MAGSRKKAIASELDSLKRHLRKDRNAIYTWEPRHVDSLVLAKVADDLNNGVLIDVAIARAHDFFKEEYIEDIHPVLRLTDSVVPYDNGGYLPSGLSFAYNASGVAEPVLTKKQQWPGWERDLGLVGAYKEILATAFKNADLKADDIRKAAATGKCLFRPLRCAGLSRRKFTPRSLMR